MNEGTLLDLAGHEADLRFRPCLLRCACLCSQTQPFTMPMPILTKKESSEKTEVGACRRALDLGRYMQVNSETRGDQRMRATHRTKGEHCDGSPEHFFNFLAKDATNT